MKERFEKRTEQFFHSVDELFDEMLGKLFTTLEAISVLTGRDFESTGTQLTEADTREVAIKRLVKDCVRNIQNRIKDEYPNYKELA